MFFALIFLIFAFKHRTLHINLMYMGVGSWCREGPWSPPEISYMVLIKYREA